MVQHEKPAAVNNLPETPVFKVIGYGPFFELAVEHRGLPYLQFPLIEMQLSCVISGQQRLVYRRELIRLFHSFVERQYELNRILLTRRRTRSIQRQVRGGGNYPARVEMGCQGNVGWCGSNCVSRETVRYVKNVEFMQVPIQHTIAASFCCKCRVVEKQLQRS